MTDWEIEQRFRDGVAHGFQLGITVKTHQEMKEITKKIEDWRRDPENMKGIPGTKFQDHNFPYKSAEEITSD